MKHLFHMHRTFLEQHVKREVESTLIVPYVGPRHALTVVSCLFARTVARDDMNKPRKQYIVHLCVSAQYKTLSTISDEVANLQNKQFSFSSC